MKNWRSVATIIISIVASVISVSALWMAWQDRQAAVSKAKAAGQEVTMWQGYGWRILMISLLLVASLSWAGFSIYDYFYGESIDEMVEKLGRGFQARRGRTEA